MNITFKKGYSIYESKGDITIVTPHSGPAFEITTSRDDNSETVASLCWKKLGGRFIVSNTSRKRVWGVDFNRADPSEETALKMYDKFVKDETPEELRKYRKKYAWVAKNKEDHKKRLEIYNNFWNEIKKEKFIVLIHRAFPRIKVVPSIMDLTTFNNESINISFLKKVVENVNKKYFDFLKNVEKEYKNVVKLEERRVISNLMRVYGKFDMTKIGIEYKKHLEDDIKRILEYAEQEYIDKLEKNFNPENFLAAVDNVLEHVGIPEITVEKAFKGLLATGPKKHLLPSKKNKIIQFEPTTFINFWYPHKGAEIICDIINEIRKS